MERIKISRFFIFIPVFSGLRIIVLAVAFLYGCRLSGQDTRRDFSDPPREFSVMPFWFWNDSLRDEEIIRQIDDFERHGVYGFVIHPRIGLPDNIKWLSTEMIHAMRTAISEARDRNMYVILYDEGMYPSGSSAGQVVERNPEHAARGLAKIDLKPGEELQLPEGAGLITYNTRPDGTRIAVIDRPSGGVIRGLHYIGEGGTGRIREESPPAGDILNPAAVSSYIELVYDKYAREFGSYFGNTVIGIFTDEPSPMGRGSARGMVPGNMDLIPVINRIIGYDIKPFLADLWYNDNPDWEKHRRDYNSAINTCLEENYYKRLGDWCADHGISLMGHPAGSMDIGTERYFQIPGQDLVWRYVEQGPTALEGQHSTMAKCASSAMIHLGQRRNSNELYGAYGHNLTWDEMEWLANWCFVRGQNLLIPHAFYYSVRGPRFDERPPDVGPNAEWWNRYKPYADACRRLSWINSDSRHVSSIAVLADATILPDKSARVCYENQYDFNYLEFRHMWEDAIIGNDGIHIAGMTYQAVILDSAVTIPDRAVSKLQELADRGRLIIYKSPADASGLSGSLIASDEKELVTCIGKLVPKDVSLSPDAKSVRYRHVIKGKDHYYLLFNEEDVNVRTTISLSAARNKLQLLDPATGKASKINLSGQFDFQPHELKIFRSQGR